MTRSDRMPKFVPFFVLLAMLSHAAAATQRVSDQHRYLYVASPGVRNDLEWGGHGVLVFDIDNGHCFIKRISLDGQGIDKKTGRELPGRTRRFSVRWGTIGFALVTRIHLDGTCPVNSILRPMIFWNGHMSPSSGENHGSGSGFGACLAEADA